MGHYTPIVGTGLTLNKVFSGLTPANLTVWDFTLLKNSTTNRAGTVNGTPAVSQINSIAPGVIGRNLTAATPPPFSSKAVNFSRTTQDEFKQPSVVTDLDFLYVNATLANIKHTIFVVAKFYNNNNLEWIFGNNGAYSPNGGYCLGVDSGSGQNIITSWMLNPAGGSDPANFVCVWGAAAITFGSYKIYAIRTDCSQAVNSRVKVWAGLSTYSTAVDYNFITSMTSSNGTEFYLGDCRSFGVADAQFDLKLFAIHNGHLTDARIEETIKKLGKYTNTPL